MSTPEPPPYPGGDDAQQPGMNPPGFPPPPPPPGVPHQYGMPAQGPVPGNSKATTSLITGILGILCCGLLGIVAVVTGKQAVAEAAVAGYPEPSNAKAGIILGWVAIGLMGVGLLFLLLAFAMGMAGSMAPTNTY